ncbi:MAG TPA: phosphatase PAP2 family protein [Candidatus Thermoplasmatota archaeon]|nr:phosphatase PAP2 family protein [Candidatus Thermoplasmatota archaeon]
MRAIDDWQWAGVAAGLALFGVLAWDGIAQGPVYQADTVVNDWVGERAADGWPTRAVGEALSLPADTYVATPVVLTFAIIWWVWGERRIATWAVVGGGGSALLVVLLKTAFGRERPLFSDLAPHSYSFPSGHTLSAAAALGILIVMGTQVHVDRQRMKGDQARRAWRIALACWIVLSFLVGSARVLAQRHWMSDVLASWCLGLALVCAVLRAAGVPRRRMPLPEPAPAPVERAAEAVEHATEAAGSKP